MRYLIFIFSLIQPIYALVFAINESAKKKSGYLSLFCIALAFATFAFAITPPIEYDLYRHYERIDSLKELPLNKILEFEEKGYVLFDIYAWIINSLGLPKQAFTFSIVLIAYFLILSIFNDIKRKYLQNASSIYILLSLIIIWLSIPFIGLSSGIRNSFANVLVVYFSYNLIFYKKLIHFLIGALIAFLMHPFGIVAPVIVLLSYKFSRWSSKSKILIIISLLLSLSYKLVELSVEFFLSFLSDLDIFKAVYFEKDGEFGSGFIDSQSLFGVIATVILPRIPLYLAQFYLITLKTKSNDTMYLLLCFLCLFYGFFQSFYVVSARMSEFFILIFSIYLILWQSNSRTRFDRIFLWVYVLSLISYSIARIYDSRFFVFDNFNIFFKPLLFILFDPT